jgi:hypothetical protein
VKFNHHNKRESSVKNCLVNLHYPPFNSTLVSKNKLGISIITTKKQDSGALRKKDSRLFLDHRYSLLETPGEKPAAPRAVTGQSLHSNMTHAMIPNQQSNSNSKTRLILDGTTDNDTHIYFKDFYIPVSSEYV